MAIDQSILDAPDLQMRQIANAIQMGQALTKDQQRRLAVRQGIEAQHGVNPMQFSGQQPGMVQTTYAGPGGQPRVGNLAPAQPAPTVQGSIYQYLIGSRMDPLGQEMARATQATNLAQMHQNLALQAQRGMREEQIAPVALESAKAGLEAQKASTEATQFRTAEAMRQQQEEAAQRLAIENMMRMGSQLRQGVGSGVLQPNVQEFLTSPAMKSIGAMYGTTPPPQSMLQAAMSEYNRASRPKAPGMETFNLPDASSVDPTTVINIRGKQYAVDTTGEVPAWKPVQTGLFGTEVSKLGSSKTKETDDAQQKKDTPAVGAMKKQGGHTYVFDGKNWK